MCAHSCITPCLHPAYTLKAISYLGRFSLFFSSSRGKMSVFISIKRYVKIIGKISTSSTPDTSHFDGSTIPFSLHTILLQGTNDKAGALSTRRTKAKLDPCTLLSSFFWTLFTLSTFWILEHLSVAVVVCSVGRVTSV